MESDPTEGRKVPDFPASIHRQGGDPLVYVGFVLPPPLLGVLV